MIYLWGSGGSGAWCALWRVVSGRARGPLFATTLYLHRLPCVFLIYIMGNELIAKWLTVIFCVGSAMQCAAHALGHLVAGRAIGGVGVGALR